DVDEVTVTPQSPMPFETGVRRQDRVGVVFAAKVVEEMRRAGRLPQELVHAPRAAVTEQQTIPAEPNAALERQGAHPDAVGGAGVREGVLGADAGEVVVARVGVAALTVAEGIR